jgi:hypothetical protein
MVYASGAFAATVKRADGVFEYQRELASRRADRLRTIRVWCSGNCNLDTSSTCQHIGGIANDETELISRCYNDLGPESDLDTYPAANGGINTDTDHCRATFKSSV